MSEDLSKRYHWDLLPDTKIECRPIKQEGSIFNGVVVVTDSGIPEGCVDMIGSDGVRRRFRVSEGR